MSVCIVKFMSVITQGITAPAMPLGMVMQPSLYRHTVARILCNCVKEIAR